MKSILFFMVFSLITNNLLAGTLHTPSYTVTIKALCEEGEVTCDNVTYIGVSRETGESIVLKGKTLHTQCKDNMTPCRFLGYEFISGEKIYRVMEDGTFEIRQDCNLLLYEQGEWVW